MAKLEGNGKAWIWQQQWQSLKAMVAMAVLECDGGVGRSWRRRRQWQSLKMTFCSLGFVVVGCGFCSLGFACCGLWLLIIEVCRRGLNRFWGLGLNGLWVWIGCGSWVGFEVSVVCSVVLVVGLKSVVVGCHWWLKVMGIWLWFFLWVGISLGLDLGFQFGVTMVGLGVWFDVLMVF